MATKPVLASFFCCETVQLEVETQLCHGFETLKLEQKV